MIDGKGKSMFAKFDPLDRTYLTTDRINAETNTRYDQNSNTLTITDGEGKTTTYEYDVRDLKTKITHPDHINGSNFGDPNNGVELFEYDAISRTIRTTDQAGDTKTSNWDMANRLLSEDYRTLANSPSGTISDSNLYEYDDASRRTKATSGRYNNVCEFTFDEAGRPQDESLTIGGQTYVASREYDADNQLVKLTYPDGSVVERTYTNRHQLETTTLNSGLGSVLIDSRVYDDSGRLLTKTFGNRVVTTNAYRSDNQIESISIKDAGNSLLDSFAYTYDQNKNVTGETRGGVMAPYSWSASDAGSFDDEDRLTGWKRTNNSLIQDWDLSLVGNWNQFTENSVVQNRTHSDAHEISAIGADLVTHDAKGNLTSYLMQSAVHNLSFDFDNKLVSVDTDGDSVADVTYEYDALGRRVRQTSSTSDTVYFCMGQQVLCDYSHGTAANTPSQLYVFGSYIDEPILKRSGVGGSATIAYYQHDRRFTVSALTDSTGAVIERYGYDAYGKTEFLNASATPLANQTSAFGNRYLYTGRELDSETGLYHFRARMYSPQLGRIISRDPLGFVDGMSLYRAYFVPTGVDPSGSLTFTVKDANWLKKCGGFLHVVTWNPDPEEKNGFIVQKVCKNHRMTSCDNQNPGNCNAPPGWKQPFNQKTCAGSCYIEIWFVIRGKVGLDQKNLGGKFATDTFGLFDCPKTFGGYEAIGEAVFVPLEWTEQNPEFDIRKLVGRGPNTAGVIWAHSLFSACFEDAKVQPYWQKIVQTFGISTTRKSSTTWWCCEREPCFGYQSDFDGQTAAK